MFLTNDLSGRRKLCFRSRKRARSLDTSRNIVGVAKNLVRAPHSNRTYNPAILRAAEYNATRSLFFARALAQLSFCAASRHRPPISRTGNGRTRAGSIGASTAPLFLGK